MRSPFILVIFGATGDLTHRKLMPALYRLVRDRAIEPPFFTVGVGRRHLTRDQFAELMVKAVRDTVGSDFSASVWKKILDGLEYQQGLFEDAPLYGGVRGLIGNFDHMAGACIPRFFYLATPPAHYEAILTNLKNSGLSEGCMPKDASARVKKSGNRASRVFIEKPFGSDLATAHHLEALLSAVFDEHQIYRIDHYLGKETVQNILAFRFGNGIFEPTWNRDFVDHVQVTLAEEGGIGTRGAFYDGVGALRDVVQNHVLQMVSLIAMERPRAFDAASIRNARVSAMEDIDCIDPRFVSQLVVRGQYEGYLREPGVAAGSRTETFAAMRFAIGNERWRGVPFYIRTGKMLANRVTEISLHYKKPVVCYGKLCLFNEENVYRNVLSLRIQPEEGISLRFMVKEPGLGMLSLTRKEMTMNYRDAFPEKTSHDAYERLFLDGIRGDQTLFARTDEIEASWQFVTKILDGWKRYRPPLYPYRKGTWGPHAAGKRIAKDGRQWFLV
ncbi:glucose-6-phosphate dehydrogenase [Patescibacteria group bacterium]|nr:glucose-6-phosphate dehydrogenase [Patescibacteria group bacterium]